MQIFQINGFGLKARLFDLYGYSFKHMISYLISFPLTMGEGWDGGRLGWGWTPWIFPPHLNPPPPWGEEVIFFDSIGV
jgi:hypothetical protein